MRPDGRRHGWGERPAALFEIISEETRRFDEREKRVVYLQLPSLQYYARIEQERGEVLLDRREGEGWRTEKFGGLEAVASLTGLGVELPLAELYERVRFAQ